MPHAPLPENPSLQHLKKQAKHVHRSVRSGDEATLELVRELHPRWGDGERTPTLFTRADAQLVVARLYGFTTWATLRGCLDVVEAFARRDVADSEPEAAADLFVALGCVSYGERDAAARLDAEPAAGADPHGGQAFDNNGLAGTALDDATHLALLVEHGLGTDRSGPWYRRLGERLTPVPELLYDEVEIAALRGLPHRMRFMITLGLELDRGGRSGLTPTQLAAP